ncbi:hypothetical protein GQ53DRAFT_825742 [Thozetella sp. PMI_491]|nr:hypothetical protein GQ53DRAFT_825742 [Thozetella sp. PMI_491]
MDNELLDEQQGFLQDDRSFEIEKGQAEFARKEEKLRQAIKWLKRLLLANFLIIVGLLAGLAWSVTHIKVVDQFVDPTLRTWSPGNVAVEYEDVVFYDGLDHFSPYQMPPDDHVDELWKDLYSGTTYIPVPAKDVSKLPNQTLIYPGTEGDGMITLEVFHLLHCLNSLRQGLFPERYPQWEMFFPNGTRNDVVTAHQMHCIDRIRQNAMCHANTGVNYWRWHERLQRWQVGMETAHTCRNYYTILMWGRAFGTDELDWTPYDPGRLTPAPQ